jgi:hypothetical protein
MKGNEGVRFSSGLHLKNLHLPISLQNILMDL